MVQVNGGRNSIPSPAHFRRPERSEHLVDAAPDALDYIEMFYNPIRRHGSAGDVSPIEFERRYAQTGQ
jgi:transposase InsO family protein